MTDGGTLVPVYDAIDVVVAADVTALDVFAAPGGEEGAGTAGAESKISRRSFESARSICVTIRRTTVLASVGVIVHWQSSATLGMGSLQI